MIELETGGNIRLEDGNMSDLWYASCVDLVKSSFISDFKELGIGGSASCVTRIHNRYLRQKFEETVHSISNKAETGSAAGARLSLETRTSGQSSTSFTSTLVAWREMSHVIEDGFRPSAEYASMGLDEAVRLATALGLLLTRSRSCWRPAGSPDSGRPTCQLIISGCILASAPCSCITPGRRAEVLLER